MQGMSGNLSRPKTWTCRQRIATGPTALWQGSVGQECSLTELCAKRPLSWLLTRKPTFVFVVENPFLAGPVRKSESGKGQQKVGEARSGSSGCQQTCGTREQAFPIQLKALRTRHLNFSTATPTIETPCKPMEEWRNKTRV